MTTDHTREALIDDVTSAIILSAEPNPTRTTSLAAVVVDAVLASPALAAHVAAVVEGKDVEIARLRDPLRPSAIDGEATWSTGWRPLASMSRATAINTCHALVDMRDRAIRRYEIAEERLDEARAALAAERERIATAIGQPRQMGLVDAARIARSAPEGGDTDG